LDKKIIYRALSPSLPIFLKDWWLDAVCGAENWTPLLYFDKNEQPIGAAFYYNARKAGLATITQPMLTPFSGIWVKPLPGDAKHKAAKLLTEISTDFAAQLPDVWHLGINLQYKLQNVLPFHWQGFKHTLRYTHTIDLTPPLSHIAKDYNMATRQRINKADNYELKVLQDSDILFEQYLASLKGVKTTITTAKLQTVVTAIRQNVAGEIFALHKKGEETPLCTALIVWDNETAYLSMMGNSKKNADAPTIMVHLLLAFCQSKGLPTFDFEGSMLQPVEQFYRSFGAVKTPYYRLLKSKNKFLHRLL
jgi:hypothetical protein